MRLSQPDSYLPPLAWCQLHLSQGVFRAFHKGLMEVNFKRLLPTCLGNTIAINQLQETNVAKLKVVRYLNVA
jgi:hypothetical protein